MAFDVEDHTGRLFSKYLSTTHLRERNYDYWLESAKRVLSAFRHYRLCEEFVMTVRITMGIESSLPFGEVGVTNDGS